VLVLGCRVWLYLEEIISSLAHTHVHEGLGGFDVVV